MTCSDFLERFSEFYDGDPMPGEREAFQDHLDSCDSCRRYHHVVDTGIRSLKAIPAARARDDFRDRVRHSIYQFDEERRRRRNALGATRVMMAVAVAVSLVVVSTAVWTPRLRIADPQVELSPIIAQEPAPAPIRELLFEPPRSQSAASPSFPSSDLWTHSNTLLYEHSPLYERYREPGMIRTGLQ